MRGKNVALIFEKTSTRTRCAFEVAAYDQGGHVTYLDPGSSQIGHKESAADTAQVLCRMFDAHRVPRQGAGHRGGAGRQLRRPGLQRADRRVAPDPDARRLPHHDRALGPSDRTSCRYCFMGDGRFNMGRSLLVTGAIMGADVRICAPEALWPDKDVQDLARERAEESGARIT